MTLVYACFVGPNFVMTVDGFCMKVYDWDPPEKTRDQHMRVKESIQRYVCICVYVCMYFAQGKHHLLRLLLPVTAEFSSDQHNLLCFI